MTQQKRLGRGLAALIGDDYNEDNVVKDVRSLRHVPIALVQRNPENPRKSFSKSDLDDLAASIREKGLLQPIIVRPVERDAEKDTQNNAETRYEIIAGERRWRASQLAKIHDVPIIIRDVSDAEAFEIALIENIQRTDLDPIEEAQGYSQLMERFDYTQEKMAETLGKSRSHIANTLRLLKLPDVVLELLRDGALSAGHARALITSDNPQEVARRIVKLGLNVRDAEALVRKKKTTPKAKTSHEKDPNVSALERELSSMIGLKVDIISKGESGQLRISYQSLEQLDEVCTRLSRPHET